MTTLLARAVRAAAGTLALFAMGAPALAAGQISGAGATFPYPIYAKWAEAYKQQTGVELNYQSIGSGGGIKQIKAQTVDFGATDKPLTPQELEQAGLTQFPTVIGGVVPVINVKGIAPGQLKLTGAALANIYLGKIVKWNDKQIADLNPGVALPASDIAVVHRSDGSGTTFNFSYYLSKVSPDWAKVGADTSLDWPVGLGGKGNEGVAALVTQTDGAIGYVEYAYALQNKLTHTQLQNKAGKFVEPDAENFAAAAANGDWSKAPGFYLILADQPGDKSWPITAATFILVYKTQQKPETGKQVLSFFDWAYKNGGKLAEELQYIPLPQNVVALIEKSWKENIKGPDGKPVF